LPYPVDKPDPSHAPEFNKAIEYSKKLLAQYPKDKLVAALKDSFQFCQTAAAQMQDAQLGDSTEFFGGHKVTRALATLITVADWADHYSQMAIYLRLNGLLPPTAKKASD